MRKLFFLVVLAAMTLTLSAQERALTINGHSLSLGASIGAVYGQSEEIVYRDGNTTDKLSQLLWDIKPLVYAGADLKYRWHKPEISLGFFADISLKFGFPLKSGVMEDRDWIALNYPEFLTHYSVHDNKTENALLMDADMGVSFQIFRRFLLKTYISYNLMDFSWKATDGSLLYPEWDIDGDGNIDGWHQYLPMDNPSPTAVITYQQTWHIISPGIAFYGEFNRYFNAEIAFKVSPLIWCNAEDDHILRNLMITDKLDIGLFIEPRLLFSFTPTDLFTLSLAVHYRNISFIRGEKTYRRNEIYQETGTPAQTLKDIGGAGYSAIDAGIIATFNLF